MPRQGLCGVRVVEEWLVGRDKPEWAIDALHLSEAIADRGELDVQTGGLERSAPQIRIVRSTQLLVRIPKNPSHHDSLGSRRQLALVPSLPVRELWMLRAPLVQPTVEFRPRELLEHCADVASVHRLPTFSFVRRAVTQDPSIE